MLKVTKFNLIIFSPLSHCGIHKQKIPIQNLTIFFCTPILQVSTSLWDHIITSSLAFITKTNKKTHIPTNLLHSRRIPRKMCFPSLWKSTSFPLFIWNAQAISLALQYIWSSHSIHLMRLYLHFKNLLICLNYQTLNWQTAGFTSTTPFYFGHTLQKD